MHPAQKTPFARPANVPMPNAHPKRIWNFLNRHKARLLQNVCATRNNLGVSSTISANSRALLGAMRKQGLPVLDTSVFETSADSPEYALGTMMISASELCASSPSFRSLPPEGKFLFKAKLALVISSQSSLFETKIKRVLAEAETRCGEYEELSLQKRALPNFRSRITRVAIKAGLAAAGAAVAGAILGVATPFFCAIAGFAAYSALGATIAARQFSAEKSSLYAHLLEVVASAGDSKKLAKRVFGLVEGMDRIQALLDSALTNLADEEKGEKGNVIFMN